MTSKVNSRFRSRKNVVTDDENNSSFQSPLKELKVTNRRKVRHTQDFQNFDLSISNQESEVKVKQKKVKTRKNKRLTTLPKIADGDDVNIKEEIKSDTSVSTQESDTLAKPEKKNTRKNKKLSHLPKIDNDEQTANNNRQNLDTSVSTQESDMSVKPEKIRRSRRLSVMLKIDNLDDVKVKEENNTTDDEQAIKKDRRRKKRNLENKENTQPSRTTTRRTEINTNSTESQSQTDEECIVQKKPKKSKRGRRKKNEKNEDSEYVLSKSESDVELKPKNLKSDFSSEDGNIENHRKRIQTLLDKPVEEIVKADKRQSFNGESEHHLVDETNLNKNPGIAKSTDEVVTASRRRTFLQRQSIITEDDKTSIGSPSVKERKRWSKPMPLSDFHHDSPNTNMSLRKSIQDIKDKNTPIKSRKSCAVVTEAVRQTTEKEPKIKKNGSNTVNSICTPGRNSKAIENASNSILKKRRSRSVTSFDEYQKNVNSVRKSVRFKVSLEKSAKPHYKSILDKFSTSQDNDDLSTISISSSPEIINLITPRKKTNSKLSHKESNTFPHDSPAHQVDELINKNKRVLNTTNNALKSGNSKGVSPSKNNRRETFEINSPIFKIAASRKSSTPKNSPVKLTRSSTFTKEDSPKISMSTHHNNKDLSFSSGTLLKDISDPGLDVTFEITEKSLSTQDEDLSSSKLANKTNVLNGTVENNTSTSFTKKTPVKKIGKNVINNTEEKKSVQKDKNNHDTSQERSTKKSARKMPNFALIHQRAFDKLESIKEMQERKAERAKKLLSGQKPVQNFTPKKDAISKKQLIFNAPTLTPSKNKSETIKNSPLTRSSPQPATSNILKSRVPVPSKLNITEKVVSKPALKREGFNRFGFKNNPAVTKEQQVKAITSKSKITTGVEKRREVLKGVRSNRRFELLMQMRKNK